MWWIFFIWILIRHSYMGTFYYLKYKHRIMSSLLVYLQSELICSCLTRKTTTFDLKIKINGTWKLLIKGQPNNNEVSSRLKSKPKLYFSLPTLTSQVPFINYVISQGVISGNTIDDFTIFRVDQKTVVSLTVSLR